MENNNELILQARYGNEEAFSMLCDQYSSLIDSLSSKYSVMCADEYSSKDDFVQEAKMAFYNAVVSYDTSSVKVTFGAYAKVCIRNRLVSCVRRQNSKKRFKGENEAQADANWSLQDTVIRRELGEKLISVADSALSAYEKRIFVLYLKGRRAKEISLVIGKSEKSVNNAIYRIRSKLKRTVT